MLRPEDLVDLIAADRRDVWSIALDVDPTKPEQQGATPAFQIRLRNGVRETLGGLPREARRAAEDVAARITEHVEVQRPRGRGWLLFAGQGLWREHTLPFPVLDRVTYGRPDLVAALWALDEHQPYAVLAVERERARLLISYLGEAALVEHEVLELDTSDWRFKAGRQPTFAKRAGTGASRGAQRDTFEARVDDHVRRFWLGAATATAHALRDLRVERLIVAGPEEAAHAARDLLPEPLRGQVLGVVPFPSHAGLAEIRDRAAPIAARAEREREGEIVAQVLAGASAGATEAVVGARATLDALVQEQAMTVAAVRDLDGEAWRCLACGYVTGAAIGACPLCGGAVERVGLRQVLPTLALRSGAAIELVEGEAAARLRPHDGIGALLRYPRG